MRIQRTRAAMSMIEVMVAMTVMTVGLMAVFGAMGNAQQANEFTRTRNRVMGEIQKVAERIQASAAIYTTTAQTPFVTQNYSSFDVGVGSGSSNMLQPWPGATQLITVRPKTTVTNAPSQLMPLVITLQWRQGENNLSTTCDYYYVPRP